MCSEPGWAAPRCARPTRACFRFSPSRPRGAETPRYPTGRALREHCGPRHHAILLLSLSSFSLVRCASHHNWPGLGGSWSVIRAPLGDRSCWAKATAAGGGDECPKSRLCKACGAASFRRQAEAKPRAVNGALWLRAERASQSWPPQLHRPLLLVPRHLPKHPLIPRAGHECPFHPTPFVPACTLGPQVHLLPHPTLYFREFR